MGCQAGCVKLQANVLNHWDPQTYNAGCYNPTSKLDDGVTPSPHAKGEAIDIGIEVPFRGRNSTGQEIFMWFYNNRVTLHIVQIIWDGQVWSASRAADGIHAYTVNLHNDHIHVQLSASAAADPTLPIPPFPGEVVAPPPPAPPVAVHTPLPILRLGSHGPAVKVAQALLNNKLHAGLKVDGEFGPATDHAVRQFQSNIQRYFHLGASFPVDGIVGGGTWYWLSK
jgi:hypothetical protein